jgi:heat-inducible transcriptional repressor
MDQYPDITPREVTILRAIIEEYMATAEPIGSETLEKKYNLGVSPATIRNEMVRLSDLGYLSQPHTSAGRAPTPMGIKYYVEHLMKPRDMSVADEVAVKERIWDYRQKLDKLLRESTRALADRTHTLALTATSEGDLYYAGTGNILSMPEFYDIEMTRALLSALDEYDFWWGMLEKQSDPFDILLGDDFYNRGHFNHMSFVYRKFGSGHLTGAICVVGPSRLNYPYVIPLVQYVGGLVDEFVGSWR